MANFAARKNQLMYKNYQFFLGQYYRLADVAALNVSFFICGFVGIFRALDFRMSFITVLIFLNILWLLISSFQNIYNLNAFANKNRYFFNVGIAILIQFAIILAFNDLIVPITKPSFILITHLVFTAFVLLFRWIVFQFYKAYLKQKGKKSCIVTAGKKDLVDEIVTYLGKNITTEFIQVIKVSKTEQLTSRLANIASKYNITELYLPVSNYSEETIEEISTYCENNFIRLRLIFDWNKLGSKKINVKQLSQTTVLYIAATPLDDPYYALLKRIFDLSFSILVSILLFSWLFPLIAIAVKLSSKGPVFFKQKRSGLNNNEFNCYKFRSMRVNQDADLKQATQDDPRITKVGNFLRKTSLDELPQFINVIKGNMSIVGPRPHMLKHTEKYSDLIGNFMERHSIKPGITGLAQVKGYRGEIDDFSLLQNRVRFDRFYVNNWTLLFDIRIVIRTFLTTLNDHR